MPSLGKLLVPAALAAGTVFSLFTAPLALYGSQQLEIQLKEERIFEGELREIATPYLALAGILSLGTGVALCAIAGWRQSNQQFDEVEKLLTEAEQKLKQKEAQLQETLLSDAYLADSGLRFFLEDDAPLSAMPKSQSTPATIAASEQPKTVTSSVFVPQSSVQSTVSPLPAAQAFLGFARTSGSEAQVVTQATQASTASEVVQPIAKMQELQNQLQHILSEIEAIQSTLQVEAQQPNPAAPSQQIAQRLQALEPAWKLQKVLS